MTAASKEMQRIAGVLSSNRFAAQNENQLQVAVARVLDAGGFQHRREVRLSGADRIDFVVGEERPLVGLELKIKGGLSALTRQVHRYVQHEELDGVLVVTTVMRLGALPPEMNGKPVQVVTLIGSML